MDIPYARVKIHSVSYGEPNGFVSTLNVRLVIDGASLIFRFGTIAIQEGLANILENHFYPPKHTSTPVLTYSICELLILHFCPNLKRNKAEVVGIMELSMLSAIPMTTFLSLIAYCKEIKKKNVSIDELLEVVLRLPMTDVIAKTVKPYTIPETCEVYMEQVDSIINAFYDALKLEDELPRDVFAEWQKDILKRGLQYRRDHPMLFANMMISPVESVNDLYDAIKIPLIVIGDYSDIHVTDETIDSNLLKFLGEKRFFTNCMETHIRVG